MTLPSLVLLTSINAPNECALQQTVAIAVQQQSDRAQFDITFLGC